MQYLVDAPLIRTLGQDPEEIGTRHLQRLLMRYAEHLATAQPHVERYLTRSDWLCLADVFNGDIQLERGLFGLADSKRILIERVRARHTAKRVGDEWYEGDADEAIEVLASKIERFSLLNVDAILTSIRFLWQYIEHIEPMTDHWWRLDFRRTFQAKSIDTEEKAEEAE